MSIYLFVSACEGFGRLPSAVPTSNSLNMSAVSINEVTCPTEFIRYSINKNCVRWKYFGATIGSIEVCGTLAMVNAVL